MAAKKKTDILNEDVTKNVTHEELLDALAVIAIKLDGVVAIIDKILGVMNKVDEEIDKKNGK